MLTIDDAFIEKIRGHDRRALSKAITLIESSNPDHRPQVDALFKKLLPISKKAQRIGISGSPGVGKSTFIEAYGCQLIAQGQSVAVITIDPTSPVSGGSILADKTRMGKLVAEERAFIRPSPSTLKSGSIHPATYETSLLCEAAGFDTVLIETVGVGQSETAITQCVDMVMVLLHPGGGDDLQGFKRGLLELADLVIVNKADGDMCTNAQSTKRHYKSGLQLLKPAHDFWDRQVTVCSAQEQSGFDKIHTHVSCFFEAATPHLADLRTTQALAAFDDTLSWRLSELVRTNSTLANTLASLSDQLKRHHLSPIQAADEVIKSLAEKFQ